MHKTPPLVAAAGSALLSLCACGQNAPEQLNAYDPQGDALKNAAPVQLPPAITESRTYRCSDNSLIYVDFYNNNTALVRRTRDGNPTTVTAVGGNPPYAGEGYSISGNGTHVTINGKACHT